jgi:hypothetical protein
LEVQESLGRMDASLFFGAFMYDQLSHLIGLMEMSKVSAKTKKRNRERVERNACLCCEKTPWRRGLCVAHYAAFLRRRSSMPARERGKYSLECERRGLILAPRESERIKSTDPFREVG